MKFGIYWVHDVCQTLCQMSNMHDLNPQHSPMTCAHNSILVLQIRK